MRSLKGEQKKTAPVIECRIYETRDISRPQIEADLVQFLMDGWNLQFCVSTPSGDLVYTMIRAVRPTVEAPAGMAVR